MELTVKVVSDAVAGYTLLEGREKFELEADKHLKIKTDPDGIDYLTASPPNGKVWIVSIVVSVQEKDIL
jgi:hypothetical protein